MEIPADQTALRDLEAEQRAALTAAMDRHAEGDDKAFGEVYDLLAPRLQAFFLRNTRDRARAEDLVQSTLMQMHRARQSFVRGSDVIPWAFAIGRRLMIDAHRRTKKEVLFESAEAARTALDHRVSLDAIPDEVATMLELFDRARAAIERLPGPQRAAFGLVREEGLSVADAANALGASVPAVKQRLFRVSEALRAILELGTAT
jgi:RNA polymerase sigma-70 factor (ECF subfamily)